jgi:hypothetical protein
MINLKKIEAQMRADHAAEPKNLGPLVNCQQRGFEFELQMALWRAREQNAGTSVCIFSQAFGAVVGSCLRNYLDHWSDDPATQSHVTRHFFEALTLTFNGGQIISDCKPYDVSLN